MKKYVLVNKQYIIQEGSDYTSFLFDKYSESSIVELLINEQIKFDLNFLNGFNMLKILVLNTETGLVEEIFFDTLDKEIEQCFKIINLK